MSRTHGIQKYSAQVLMTIGVLAVALMTTSIAKEAQLSVLPVTVDRDQDGLSNKEEMLYGTDPDNRDTDGDGFSDGVEIQNGYDPLVPASQGDRLTGINPHRTTVSPEAVAQSRQLTNELRTRVAGVAYDVVSGKEVSLDDVGKEVEQLLQNVKTPDVRDVDISRIRIKKQDYADLSEKERKARLNKDAQTYLTALGYIMSLYAPYPLTEDGTRQFTDELKQNTIGLYDDFSNIGYFKKLQPRAEKFVDGLYDLEVPEALLPLHVEGLQFAETSLAVAREANNSIKSDDPVSAVVQFTRVKAMLSLASSFAAKAADTFAAYDVKLF